MTTQTTKPMTSFKRGLVGCLGLLAAAGAWADDLTGENEFLCAAASVIVCLDDGTCVSAQPWELNVPEFINFDLKKKQLSTTKASGSNRVTIANNLSRSDGRVYLQGIDRGRAYSFVIDVASGFMTAVVARDDLTVSAFGACTPTP